MAKDGRKEVRKNLSGTKVYFSFIPSYSGFTDQLWQFTSVYRLGVFLGYKYYHQPFTSHRSSTNPKHSKLFNNKRFLPRLKRFWLEHFALKILRQTDIYDFLGVNDHLKQISDMIHDIKLKEINIPLNDILYNFEKVQSFDLLVKYIRNKVSESSKHITSLKINFSFEESRIFRRMILEHCPQIPSKLNLRQAYLNKHKPKIAKDRSDSKIDVLIHIRQGDSAIVKTPWNTFIPVWNMDKNPFSEYKSMNDIDTPNRIFIDEYYDVCNSLFFSHVRNNISLKLFSDGFERAFLSIYNNNDKNQKLTPRQLSALKDYQKSYSGEAFKQFLKNENVKVNIGESIESLQKFIRAIFKADIIVTGTQNWMIPKFLSLYFNQDNLPVVVLLHRGNKPVMKRFGIEEGNPKLIFVSVNNFDPTHIRNQIFNSPNMMIDPIDKSGAV